MKIAIFGQYKSGTTALFYSIKDVLPKNARLLFEPTEYVADETAGHRYVLAKVILGSSGDELRVRYETFADFEKKLLLVRDPRDWVVSGTLFAIQQEPSIYRNETALSAVVSLLQQKEGDPASLPLIAVLECILDAIPGQSLDRLRAWIEEQQRWLLRFHDELGPHLVVRYEEFVDGRVAPLQAYLGLAPNLPPAIDDVHEHTIRTKSHGNWRDWFVEQDVLFFRPLFVEYMRRYGYGDDWRLRDRPRILSRHCSEYVTRMVDRRIRTSRGAV